MSTAGLPSDASVVLDAIVEAYLSSGDFNGLPIRGTLPAEWSLPEVTSLVLDGRVQVVTEEDFPNPHVRPWPSRRPPESQVDSFLEAAAPNGPLCCLYPTPLAMLDQPLPKMAGRPYTEAMARGRGTLELAFFEMAAIETYRNDPRYHFRYDDFGVDFGIGDAAYMDDSEPDRDKIHTVKAGFAYDAAGLADRAVLIRRYVCVFHCDLARMTSEHQQRMKTWEHDGNEVVPHPTWWQMQMGEWPDRIGPFDKILVEIQALNEIWTLGYGAALFRRVDRPREWGWVLRPSTSEWDAFVHATDKLLSENLNTKALDACGAPSVDAEGNPAGTLKRLELFLTTRSTASAENVREVMKPLRDVRRLRQVPAHAIAEPVTDSGVFARQRELLRDVAGSLGALRWFMSRHPKVVAAGWEPGEADSPWLTL